MSTAAVTPDFQYIKLPDGSYGKFRADADDSTIKSTIEQQYPGTYKDLPSQPAPDRSAQALSAAEGVGTGVIKGMGNTVHGVSSILNKIPYVGEYLAPSAGVNALHLATRPNGPAEKTGYYGEQIGEFLLPTGLEEKAGVMLGKAIPSAAKLAPAVGRVAAQTADSAILNKLQGGDAKTGAESGLVGGALGEGGRALAPVIAESALGITKRMRGYGKTPGKAVLDEISGVRPGTILKNASSKSNALTQELEGIAANHAGTIDMRPAIGTVDNEIAKAGARNNAKAITQLNDVKQALTKNAVNGLPLSADQTASGALNLKRGMRDQFVRNWNPEVQAEIPDVAKRASRSIDSGLDAALGPKFSKLNQRVSSLIPVADRAESVSRGAPLGQRVLHRVGAHTGALAGATGGGILGYEHGGARGAVVGALGGAVLPEVIASPAIQIGAARTLHSPLTGKAATGAALQAIRALRANPENPEPEETDER